MREAPHEEWSHLLHVMTAVVHLIKAIEVFHTRVFAQVCFSFKAMVSG
jgi:hypothetical protein